jgi:hypothetical protein
MHNSNPLTSTANQDPARLPADMEEVLEDHYLLLLSSLVQVHQRATRHSQTMPQSRFLLEKEIWETVMMFSDQEAV